MRCGVDGSGVEDAEIGVLALRFKVQSLKVWSLVFRV